MAFMNSPTTGGPATAQHKVMASFGSQVQRSSMRRSSSGAVLPVHFEGLQVATRLKGLKRSRSLAQLSPQAQASGTSEWSSGGRAYIAGVPLARPVSLSGLRLAWTLVNRPHELMQSVQHELDFVAGDRPLPSSYPRRGPEGGEQSTVRGGRGGASVRPSGPRVGEPAASRETSARTTTVCNSETFQAEEDLRQWQAIKWSCDGAGKYSWSMKPPGTQDDGEGEDEESPYAATTMPSGDPYVDDQRRCREDVIYTWAMAESYLSHPMMMGNMKLILGRETEMALAVGADLVIRQSRISLLDYNQGGNYLVGGVRFEHAGKCRPSIWTTGNNEALRKAHAETGFNPTQSAEDLVTDWFDVLFGPVENDKKKEEEGSENKVPPPDEVPECIQFDPKDFKGGGIGLTRRYRVKRLYERCLTLGYLERRAALEVDDPLEASLEGAVTGVILPDTKGRLTYDMKLRTFDVERVAERHLWALFSNGISACITTFDSLVSLVHEARSFGRALCDAEQYVFQLHPTAPQLVPRPLPPSSESEIPESFARGEG